jgi:hypothetical protein
MWHWYRDAAECYVYLVDVSAKAERDIAADLLRFDDAARGQFRSARWFGRGWTLQELLAPKIELFCNNCWEVIATKADIGVELSKITSIPLIFLDGTVSPSDNKPCRIAMRMSWVSRRQTTRTEDMAYCMLGLFDVLHVAARYRSCNEWKLCLLFYLGNWRASLILMCKGNRYLPEIFAT